MHSFKFLLIIIMFTNSNLFSYEEGKALNQDIEIYYRDYGPADAEPILLVQGLGGQLINWPQHLIEFLIENNFHFPCFSTFSKNRRIFLHFLKILHEIRSKQVGSNFFV